MPVQRRLSLGLAIAAVVAMALAACARNVVRTAADGDLCKGVTDWTTQMVPLAQTVKWYEKHQPACIKAIADSQDVSTDVGNGQPVTVGAAGACPSTTIVVNSYQGAGAIDSAEYGDGTGKFRGFVVAKITNTGSCEMGESFPLPAGQTVYWVIDKKSPNDGGEWHSHFVFADGSYLANKEDWGIARCHHTPKTSNYAQFRPVNACDEGIGPETQSLSASSAKKKGPRGPDDGPAYWISCGGDCCYSNDF